MAIITMSRKCPRKTVSIVSDGQYMTFVTRWFQAATAQFKIQTGSECNYIQFSSIFYSQLPHSMMCRLSPRLTSALSGMMYMTIALQKTLILIPTLTWYRLTTPYTMLLQKVKWVFAWHPISENWACNQMWSKSHNAITNSSPPFKSTPFGNFPSKPRCINLNEIMVSDYISQIN